MRTRRNFLVWLSSGALASLPLTRRWLTFADAEQPRAMPARLPPAPLPQELSYLPLESQKPLTDELSWELVRNAVPRSPTIVEQTGIIPMQTRSGLLMADGIGVGDYEPVKTWRHRRTGELRYEPGPLRGYLRVGRLTGPADTMRRVLNVSNCEDVTFEHQGWRQHMTRLSLLFYTYADLKPLATAEDLHFVFDAVTEELVTDRFTPMV